MHDHVQGTSRSTRHTSMTPRTQQTPFGEVILSSRWKHDRYYLVAAGPLAALRVMFPSGESAFETVTAECARHTFAPAPTPITVERVLQRICTQWQEAWDDLFVDFVQRQPTDTGGQAEQLPRALGQVITRYLTLRADELAFSTRERNRHYLARWASALGEQRLLSELTEERLIAGRTFLATVLKPSTLNCALAVLKTVLRWAEVRSIPVHPAYRMLRGIRVVSQAQGKAWWTPDEVDLALTAAIEVDRELATRHDDAPAGTATLLIALGCHLGLRYEEIIMQRWEELDLEAIDQRTQAPAPVAHIVAKEGWVPKDGEARTVPMHERLVELIRPFRRAKGWVLNSHKAMPKRGGTKRVYRYDPKKIWLRVLAKATTAGAKTITPHGMRHAFASNLLMAGVSDVLVARWMGHANTSMVHSHYGHLLSYHSDINRVQFPHRHVVTTSTQKAHA